MRVDLSAYAELVVRLANAAAGDEEEVCGGEEAHDISTLDGLRSLLTDMQFPDTRVTRTDLDAMRALRVEFRTIFTACAEENGAEAVDRLNALLIQHPVHPQISGHDDQRWHLHLTQGGTVADRYAAESAMGLATIITRLGINRLGICGAPACPGIFIDTSTNKSRRYCSDRCASRANVTAFRARRRASGTHDALPTAAV
jgi:predicted RNA-binding Zn ribbon-like protein